MIIRLYQLPVEDDLCFRSYSTAIKNNRKIDLKNYNSNYALSLNESDNERPYEELCEMMYLHFQDNEKTKCRSMSVSDILQIDNTFWFCDSFGFVKLEKERDSIYA